jgi:dipeptidyl aminopeptidase/acylaminoacyl peptidase
MRRHIPLFLITFFSFFLISTMAESETGHHQFTVKDMLAMKRIGDPQVSPSGSKIVFSLREINPDENRGITNLWKVAADGTGLVQLTNNSFPDFNPRWSSDGKVIYFLSARSGSSQVWRINTEGGEAEPVTGFPLDLGGLELSPDGKTLLVSMDVFPGKSPEETSEKLSENKKQGNTGQLYDSLFVRHWDNWVDGRRSHLFAVQAENPGQCLDLMPGMDADSPSKPFGGFEETAFSPDSKYVVFSARNVGHREAWSTNFDLYQVPVDGSTSPRCLTVDNPAWDTSPSFSPDGETLAYLAMEKPGFEADRYRIVLMGTRTGRKRILAEDWDRSPGSLTWSLDSKTLYTSAANTGQNSIFAINVINGETRVVIEQGSNSLVTLNGEKLYYVSDNLKSPAEIFSSATDGSDLEQVTSINAEHLKTVLMGDFEQFSFKGWNEEEVWCYVVKPVNYDVNKKYPVAFLVHGGPQGSFGNHFHYRWNPQAYAGAGYAAVMVDFHGSTGYGQAFTDSISQDWGGKPLEDLKKGLAATLERYPWMDGENVGALGASYGGFMINWIAGNWPDRFKCLINHDGVFDMRSMYFGTEELWFPEWEQGGPYWMDPEQHEKHNPVRFVSEWKTPMLVIHGLLDYRIPLSQGLSAFTALQRREIPSKLLYFPDENHWVMQPKNCIQWHDTVLEWLDQWLN